jgi:hypothetical protein
MDQRHQSHPVKISAHASPIHGFQTAEFHTFTAVAMAIKADAVSAGMARKVL